MTQQERIIAYVKEFGSISPLEAFKDIGCMRLAAQIFELEKKGNLFNHVNEHATKRFGEATHYTRYYLVKEPDDEQI